MLEISFQISDSHFGKRDIGEVNNHDELESNTYSFQGKHLSEEMSVYLRARHHSLKTSAMKLIFYLTTTAHATFHDSLNQPGDAYLLRFEHVWKSILAPLVFFFVCCFYCKFTRERKKKL